MSRLLLYRIVRPVRPIRHPHIVPGGITFGYYTSDGCDCAKVSVCLNEYRICRQACRGNKFMFQTMSYLFLKMAQPVKLSKDKAFSVMYFSMAVRQIDIAYYILTSNKYGLNDTKIIACSESYVITRNNRILSYPRKYNEAL